MKVASQHVTVLLSDLFGRDGIKLFSEITKNDIFCIYSDALGLYDFAWFCFDTAVPEHKEPQYWDWDELHGLEAQCPLFDTYKVERESYNLNNSLWINEDFANFNFQYDLDTDGKLSQTCVCIPNNLELLKQSYSDIARILIDYEPIGHPRSSYCDKHIIYANSAGWYELGRIALFLSKCESRDCFILLSELDCLYKKSLPLQIEKKSR